MGEVRGRGPRHRGHPTRAHRRLHERSGPRPRLRGRAAPGWRVRGPIEPGRRHGRPRRHVALSPAVRLRVDDPSGVAPARRAAEQLADDLGFDERRRGEVAIVVTELATNLVRHGGGGEIVLRVSRAETPTVDAIAYDRGDGIRDPARALEDGYSTAGGPGNGLGAIERLAGTMDIQTGATGTVVAARLGANDTVPVVDGIALAMAGETASGDAWACVRDAAQVTILLADGL